MQKSMVVALALALLCAVSVEAVAGHSQQSATSRKRLRAIHAIGQPVNFDALDEGFENLGYMQIKNAMKAAGFPEDAVDKCMDKAELLSLVKEAKDAKAQPEAQAAKEAKKKNDDSLEPGDLSFNIVKNVYTPEQELDVEPQVSFTKELMAKMKDTPNYWAEKVLSKEEQELSSRDTMCEGTATNLLSMYMAWYDNAPEGAVRPNTHGLYMPERWAEEDRDWDQTEGTDHQPDPNRIPTTFFEGGRHGESSGWEEEWMHLVLKSKDAINKKFEGSAWTNLGAVVDDSFDKRMIDFGSQDIDHEFVIEAIGERCYLLQSWFKTFSLHSWLMGEEDLNDVVDTSWMDDASKTAYKSARDKWGLGKSFACKEFDLEEFTEAFRPLTLDKSQVPERYMYGPGTSRPTEVRSTVSFSDTTWRLVSYPLATV